MSFNPRRSVRILRRTTRSTNSTLWLQSNGFLVMQRLWARVRRCFVCLSPTFSCRSIPISSGGWATVRWDIMGCPSRSSRTLPKFVRLSHLCSIYRSSHSCIYRFREVRISPNRHRACLLDPFPFARDLRAQHDER